MMKQLDIEYKNQISAELPDLWSRIEAGVDAYEASKKNNASQEDASNIVKTSNVEDMDVLINKLARKRRFAIAGRIVAAAACLFVVVGVVRMMGGRKDYSSDAGASYEASDSAADYSAAPSFDDYDYAAEAACEAEPEYEEDVSEAEMCEATTASEDEATLENGGVAKVTADATTNATTKRGLTANMGANPKETFANNLVTEINGVDISDSGYRVSLLYKVATEDIGLQAENVESSQKTYVMAKEKKLAKDVLSFEAEEAEELFGKLKMISVSPVASITVDDLFADYPDILGEPMSEEFGTYVVTTEDGLMYQIYTFNEEKLQVVMILGVSEE